MVSDSTVTKQEKRNDDSVRHRYVCMTVNNYKGHELPRLKAWKQVSYAIVAYEVGESGTPHLQIYVEFVQQVMRGTIRQLLECAPHFEARRGTPVEASNYCKKGDQGKAEWKSLNTDGPNFGKNAKFEEWGEISHQGRRTDLQAIADAVGEKKSLREIALLYPVEFIKFHRGIERLVEVTQVSEDPAEYDLESCSQRLELDPFDFSEEKAYVLEGPSGVGKTEFAKAHFKCPLVVSHMDDLRKFQPAIHDGIVFDDMDFRHMPRCAQIHLMDWTQNRSIHARYGCSWIPKHTKKIVCCNEYPLMYNSAIDRRVCHVKLAGNSVYSGPRSVYAPVPF